MLAENTQLSIITANERSDFMLGTLHYQRKLASFFWRQLSFYLKFDLISRKVVFNWFAQDDVEIVEKIIIPIENRLADFYGISRLNPKTDLLYYLSSVKNKFYS
jgi:hypothetical protein